MRSQEASAHVRRRLGWRGPLQARPLSGGSLNHVFRVRGDASVVVKHAPPYVAADPMVPLDPSRSAFEARALRLMGPGGQLAGVWDDAVRPPRLLDEDRDGATLILEDVGDLPDLQRWLREGGDTVGLVELVARLAALHRRSAAMPELAESMYNRPMQHTRWEVQYRRVEGWLAAEGVADAAQLAAPVHQLGRSLCEPGHCLVMGDPWPPSILLDEGRVRLIDWELATWGRPCQDLGHVLAHLDMLSHIGAAPRLSAELMACYLEIHPLGELELRDVELHRAAEQIARLHGPFARSGPYARARPEARALGHREAVARLRALR